MVLRLSANDNSDLNAAHDEICAEKHAICGYWKLAAHLLSFGNPSNVHDELNDGNDQHN